MRTRFQRALRQTFWLALLTVAWGCGDTGGDLNGCPIISQYGPWFTGQQGSYEYLPVIAGQARCPVAILHPGERITGGGLVIEEHEGVEFPTSRAVLQVINSAGEGLIANITPFFRFDIYENHANLFLEYDAATGTRSFSDHDVLNLSIRDFCGCVVDPLRAQLKLGATYRADGPLHVAVAGNDVPLPGTSASWSPDTDNGGRPHQFNWFRDGAWVGSGPAYDGAAGSAPFVLRVDMTDAYGRTASGSMAVEPGGVRAALSGPGTVYLSDGGGEWTVTGRGGIPPYAFVWYLDNTYAGDGPAWASYPGQGTHVLRVEMHDQAGAQHSVTRVVNGIGDDQCVPTPPALTC
jgi:hypothetical protein